MRLSGSGSRIASSFGLSALCLLAFWAAAPSCLPLRGDKPVKEVRVEAGQFEFMPATIELDKDASLRLILTSRDVVHGFNIIGTEINVIIPAKGEGEAVVIFDPEQPGEYRFKCSKVCGPGHLVMRGLIVVH